jgi:hypothetical protein
MIARLHNHIGDVYLESSESRKNLEMPSIRSAIIHPSKYISTIKGLDKRYPKGNIFVTFVYGGNIGGSYMVPLDGAIDVPHILRNVSKFHKLEGVEKQLAEEDTFDPF